jgi:hypothetical protein
MNSLVEPSLEVAGAELGIPLEELGELDLIERSHLLLYQRALLVPLDRLLPLIQVTRLQALVARQRPPGLVAQKMLSVHPFEQGADAALGVPLEEWGELYLIGRSHLLEYQEMLLVPLERLLTLMEMGTLQSRLVRQRSQELVVQRTLSLDLFEQVAGAELRIRLGEWGELHLIGRSHLLESQGTLFVPLDRLLPLVQVETLEVMLLRQYSQELVVQRTLSLDLFEQVAGAGRGVPLEALGELDLIERSHLLQEQGTLFVPLDRLLPLIQVTRLQPLLARQHSHRLATQKMLSLDPFEQGAGAGRGVPLEEWGELDLIGRSHLLQEQGIRFVPLDRLLTLMEMGTLQSRLVRQRSQELVAQKMLSLDPFEQVTGAELEIPLEALRELDLIERSHLLQEQGTLFVPLDRLLPLIQVTRLQSLVVRQCFQELVAQKMLSLDPFE